MSMKSEQTRHLGEPGDRGAMMPRRVTGPLDEALPWVIEFRIVGTASTLQMRVSQMMTIGRSDPEHSIEPDINLSPFAGHVMGVSRQHAAISARDNSISIKDLGSANGTRLNGYVLAPHQSYRLRHGDELTFGQLTVQVLFAVVPLVKAHAADDTIIPAIGGGQHVLVVEDDTDVAAVFGMILEQAGFRVSIVNNGALAMSLLGRSRVDAVVLDLMLPDMDGLDLATYIRKQESDNRHMPMIVISGSTGGFQMNKALGAGVDLFLGKPVGVDELVEAFSRLLPQMA
ncbi:MAG: response regulator [Anaerolineae bacterium]|nr:response regulator [Anaerolineae bacterium]